MEKKRIKLVQVIADSAIGGGVSHVLSLLSKLDKDRFEVILICPTGYLSKEAKKIRNVEVLNIPMVSKFDLESIFALKARLAEIQASGNPFGPMIIHAHGQRAGFFVSLVTPGSALKIYTEHNYDESYRLKNPINDLLQRIILRRVCKKFDLVIAVSGNVKKYLTDHRFASEGKVVVVPNGIDLEVWQKKGRKGKIETANRHPIIGTVGSLVAKKGQRYLIEAFASFTSKYPLARLEIVGAGPKRQELEELVESLNLKKNVFFYGAKRQVASIITKWDLFVLPSLSETFGIVILEAMALGVPVIASRIGGIPDIIENRKDGLLVDSQNSQALYEAMADMIEHPVLAASLRRSAMERVKAFEIKKIIKNIEEIYLLLVG